MDRLSTIRFKFFTRTGSARVARQRLQRDLCGSSGHTARKRRRSSPDAAASPIEVASPLLARAAGEEYQADLLQSLLIRDTHC
jgi:hypothetical protein